MSPESRSAPPRRHRRLIWLTGRAGRCRAVAADWMRGLPSACRVVWVGLEAPSGVRHVPPAQADLLLGDELDVLVFDATDRFTPDAFGAAVGAVAGGGVVWLLMPQPAGAASRFESRIARILEADPSVQRCPVDSQDEVLSTPAPCPLLESPAPGSEGDECRTADQRRAVAALVRLARGRTRRPLVLTSDRGRGKSAALGIAAARVLATGLRRHVVVTAARSDAVETVFRHAQRGLVGAAVEHWRRMRHGDAVLEYVPPDELRARACGADLVLVDEAAGIPVHLLRGLLEECPRIAFATTVHGYEGSGQGFALRFGATLRARTPLLTSLRLETPIRWAVDDPVEALTARLLLLDAQSAPAEALADCEAETCRYQIVDRDGLAADEVRLHEVFGLLIDAHYRTRPSDLMRLLNDEAVSVHVLVHAGHVTAVTLVAAEGGLDADTAHAVWRGERRPQGHLLPVGLSLHAGLEQAARMRFHRVVRIAVHPEVQGRGLGTRLLEEVRRVAQTAGADALGASFGITTALLGFWRRCGYWPVRLGMRHEAGSGTPAVMVMRPLSAAGADLMQTARGRLREALPLLLADTHRRLEPDAVMAVLRAPDPMRPALDELAWRDLLGFAAAHRTYETAIPALAALAHAALSNASVAVRLSDGERDALVMKVLQHRDWSEVAKALGVSGRKEVVALLRPAVRRVLGELGGEAVLRLAARCAIEL